MGNDNSKPVNERIYIGVVEDNPAGVKALIESLPNYPTYDTKELQWMDKRGRTPLIVAAKRGHLKCANVLLQGGADINFMNRLPETTGTALHEAIYEKHERMSELLLTSGANPFLANSYGSTALDVALQANFGPMIQRLKAIAVHTDTASFKVPTFGGMSTGFKPRFLVLVPYHPFSKSSGHQKVTKQLLIFNDAKSTTIRSRIWMHLSSLKAAKDGVVVLHLAPSHRHPGDDLVTTFDRGHCLFLKEENSTPDAMGRFKKLLTILKEASAIATVTPTKAQPIDSKALKPDSSAASFNSSSALTDSGRSRPPGALDADHLADNSGSGDLKTPTKPIHKEHAPGSPEGQSSPSTPLQEQQLQQEGQHQQQEDQQQQQQEDQHQHQQQQQPAQPFTPSSAQQEPEEHHPSHSLSDPHGSQPPSGVNFASSTPHKRSNSIWSKSGDAGRGDMKSVEQARPDVQATVTTLTSHSKQAGTHEPAAPAEAAAATTQQPVAIAAGMGPGTETALPENGSSKPVTSTTMQGCTHAAASPAIHAAAAPAGKRTLLQEATAVDIASGDSTVLDVSARSSRSINVNEDTQLLQAAQKEKAAAIQEQLWLVEEKKLGIQEQRLRYHLEQEEQVAKAAAVREQLWSVEEKKLGIQEQRLRYHLKQEKQVAGEESKKKADKIMQQLWAIEERKLTIQEEQLRFQLQQEA